MLVLRLELVLSVADLVNLVDLIEEVWITRNRLLLGVELFSCLTLRIRVDVLLHVVELLVLDAAHQLPPLSR